MAVVAHETFCSSLRVDDSGSEWLVVVAIDYGVHFFVMLFVILLVVVVVNESIVRATNSAGLIKRELQNFVRGCAL